MNVVIATCFKSNEERVESIKEVFEKRGDQVDVITTDFNHVRHQKRDDLNKDYYYINTKEYKKNISINRLLSHKKFSKDAFHKIGELNPDFIWLMAPANSLIEEATKYKVNHSNTKLIIDIIDMWPESLPVHINKDNFIFNTWKNIRANNLKCADVLVIECDYYKEILKKEYLGNIQTLRWSRNQNTIKTNLNLPEDKLSLLYLGSINNIINVDLICKVIQQFDKEVVLHIIGDGENKKEFIQKLSSFCKVIDHGEQRDIDVKSNILKECHAGLNIYEEGLYIGLTVKSIDYMQYGLPIINNIKGDTWSLIEDYHIGFNVDKNTRIQSKDIIDMRLNNKHIFDLFNSKFSKDCFDKECLNIIKGVAK